MNNMVKRILVAIIAAPLILYSPFAGLEYFSFFIFVISFLGAKEIIGFYNSRGLKLNTISPYLTAFIPVIFYQFGFETMMLSVISFTFMLFLLEIFRAKDKPTHIVSGYLLMLIYCGVFPTLLIGAIDSTIPMMFIFVYSIIIATDTFAYFGGLSMSKLVRTHKLLKRISPKKTIEGAVSGLIFAVVTGYLVWNFSEIGTILSFNDALILSFLISVIGQTGDLFESMLKRDFNIKDSSKLIPGHGGILDRFDSLIFVSPLVFTYLNYFTT